MESDAVAALRTDRSALLEICDGLTAADWQAESGCPGWSVKDLVAHLALICWSVVDPSRLLDMAPGIMALSVEEGAEVVLESRRDWDAARVRADYEEVSEQAAARLTGLASLSGEVPLGPLGTFPARLAPTAWTFDHYTHIRADLFGPRGPLPGPPPPSDELRVVPTLEWIEAALPKQNADAVTAAALEFRITGTGARTISFGSGGPKATITSDALSFVRWITQRGGWAELKVEAAGDDEALSVASKLKVF
jgi:uncharacterized protein (TIGR03083 family)